jgi:Skp family chaperone for outer membrane proteins
MSEPSRGLRAIVLSAIVLCIVASMVGAGAQDKNGLRIGVVSPGRLLADYKFAKASREQLDKMQAEVNLTLATWDRYHMLSPTDQDALTKLVLKENATPNDLTKAEKQQMDDLKNKHEAMFKRLNQLLQTPVGQVQPADAAELDRLQKVRTDTLARMKDKKTTAEKELQNLDESNNIKIDKDVREQLNKVAKEKSLNLVFSNQVLLFADIDITDDVLKQLNALK